MYYFDNRLKNKEHISFIKIDIHQMLYKSSIFIPFPTLWGVITDNMIEFNCNQIKFLSKSNINKNKALSCNELMMPFKNNIVKEFVLKVFCYCFTINNHYSLTLKNEAYIHLTDC